MLKVLVVDDSSTIRKMLERMLTDMNCNVIATAKSGLESIALYNKYQPDFVTMDVNMPGMSGLDALKKIRDKYPDAKIIMLTSIGDDKLVTQAIKYGAKGYILKPLNQEKIEDVIESIFPQNDLSFVPNNENNSSTIENYGDSIKDSLTDFYTIQYMHHTIQHLIEIHDRNDNINIGLLIINITNLNDVTTQFGAIQKDIITTQVADEIQSVIRGTDFPIKLTDDEFGIFVVGVSKEDIHIIANKLKIHIENIRNETAIKDTKLNVSIGMTFHEQKEKLISFLERADKAVVYANKEEEKRIFLLE